MNSSPLVKNTEIEITTRTIGKALHIPYRCPTLNESTWIMMKSSQKIFFPVKPLPWQQLQPVPRLIGRILAYNICPKMRSFNYFSRELSACVYGIMARLDGNWAQIILDNLVKEHTTFLPYGAYPCTHLQKIQSGSCFRVQCNQVF